MGQFETVMHNYREFSQPLSAYPLKISRYAPLTQNLSHIRSFMISSHHNCVYKLSLNANSLLGEWESVHYLNYFRKLHCSMVSTKGFFFQDSYILFLSKRWMKVLGRYWIISKPKLLYVLHRLWIIWNFIFWSQETTYIMDWFNYDEGQLCCNLKTHIFYILHFLSATINITKQS